MIDRRGFFKRMMAAAAGAALAELDPEKLLWVPGEKKIFDLASVAPKIVEAPPVEIAQIETPAQVYAPYQYHELIRGPQIASPGRFTFAEVTKEGGVVSGRLDGDTVTSAYYNGPRGSVPGFPNGASRGIGVEVGESRPLTEQERVVLAQKMFARRAGSEKTERQMFDDLMRKNRGSR